MCQIKLRVCQFLSANFPLYCIVLYAVETMSHLLTLTWILVETWKRVTFLKKNWGDVTLSLPASSPFHTPLHVYTPARLAHNTPNASINVPSWRAVSIIASLCYQASPSSIGQYYTVDLRRLHRSSCQVCSVRWAHFYPMKVIS